MSPNEKPALFLCAFVALVLAAFFVVSCSPCDNDASPICDACRQDCLDAPDVAACEKGCSDVCSSCSREEEIWGEQR